MKPRSFFPILLALAPLSLGFAYTVLPHFREPIVLFYKRNVPESLQTKVEVFFSKWLKLPRETIKPVHSITDWLKDVSPFVVGVTSPVSVSGWLLETRDGEAWVVTTDSGLDVGEIAKLRVGSEQGISAKVVGKDPLLGVALLRFKVSQVLESNLTGISWEKVRDALPVERGGALFAVGRGGADVAVLQGIVSSIDQKILSDFFLKPAHSEFLGGPVFDEDGLLVGLLEPDGWISPIRPIREALSDLKTRGYVQRGTLGVEVGDLDEEISDHLKVGKKRGAIIVSVQSQQLSEESPFRPLDVVVNLAGKSVESAQDFRIILESLKPNTPVEVTLIRQGEEMEVSPKISELNLVSEKSKAYVDAETGLTVEETASGLLLITAVKPEGIADRAGLEAGDFVIGIEGFPSAHMRSFKAALNKKKKIALRVKHPETKDKNPYSIRLLKF